MPNAFELDAGPEDGQLVDAGVVDDGGVGVPCAGPNADNPDPAPGVYWEQTNRHDAGLWVGPIYGPYGPEDLVFIPEAELGKGFAQFVDVTLSVTPFVGQAKDVVEAVTGHNFITGEDLDGFERALAIIGALGTIGDATSYVAKGLAGVDEAAEVLKRVEAVREADPAGWSLDTTLKFWDAFTKADAAVRAAEMSRAGVAGRILSGVGKIDTFADWTELMATVAGAVSAEGGNEPDLDGDESPPEQDHRGDTPTQHEGDADAATTPQSPPSATDDNAFKVETEDHAGEREDASAAPPGGLLGAATAIGATLLSNHDAGFDEDSDSTDALPDIQAEPRPSEAEPTPTAKASTEEATQDALGATVAMFAGAGQVMAATLLATVKTDAEPTSGTDDLIPDARERGGESGDGGDMIPDAGEPGRPAGQTSEMAPDAHETQEMPGDRPAEAQTTDVVAPATDDAGPVVAPQVLDGGGAS